MNIPRKRSFWAVSIGHMTTDIFMSMGPVLLAFLSVNVLSINNTQIGAAVSAQQLAGAVSQPLFGWLADRGGERWQRALGAGGVAWVVAFLSLSVALAMSGEFWLMIIPFAVAALGSGAFHPVGTMLAAEDDTARTSSNVAIFFMMGQIGLALGPALAGFLLDQANPAGAAGTSVAPIFALALAAIPAVGFTGLAMAPTAPRRHDPAAPRPALTQNLPVKGLLLLAAMVTLRSLGQPGAVAFIPRLFQQQGWAPTEYGLITSSFWIASGIMGVVLGQLGDRYDRRYLIAGSLLLAVPGLFFLPTAGSKPLSFALAILTGGMAGGSHSLIVVMAQSLFPASKGLASGAILGFIFGAGALGSLVFGTLSDQIGITATFQIIAGLVAVGGLLAALLPDKRATAPTTDAAEVEATPAK